MYYCNLTADKKFYVQLFLTVVTGFWLFKYLWTVNVIQYDTIWKDCIALQLVEDDWHWSYTFEKTMTYASGKKL